MSAVVLGGTPEVTGRDDWIIAVALFTAAKALRAERHPRLSDIADMERLLAARHPAEAAALAGITNLQLARRRGFDLDVVDDDTVCRWLDENPAAPNILPLTFVSNSVADGDAVEEPPR
jgi:hypothetical protein